jgi:hypothetical protein
MKTLRCATPNCGSELWRVKEEQKDGKQLKSLKCETCGMTIGVFLLFDPAQDTSVAFH